MTRTKFVSYEVKGETKEETNGKVTYQTKGYFRGITADGPSLVGNMFRQHPDLRDCSRVHVLSCYPIN